jgi:hypothetical protein
VPEVVDLVRVDQMKSCQEQRNYEGTAAQVGRVFHSDDSKVCRDVSSDDKDQELIVSQTLVPMTE